MQHSLLQQYVNILLQQVVLLVNIFKYNIFNTLAYG